MGKILRTIIELFGSFFTTIGISIIILSLFLLHLGSNLDTIQDVASPAFDSFLQDHRAEIIENFMGQDENFKNFDKSQITLACKSKKLSEKLCSQIDSLPEDELKKQALDELLTPDMVQKLKTEFLGSLVSGLNESLKNAQQVFKLFKIGALIGLTVYLIGAFLIIIALKFLWLKAFYRISLKSLIDSATILGLVLLFKFSNTGSISSYILKSMSYSPVQLPEVPQVFIQLVMDIILEWMKSSTAYLIIILGGMITTFFTLTVILFFKKKKTKNLKQ